ncbi:multiple C2 and transmembrane domain-containing protein-like [Aricia agestis]|uniref:multiple C2 and transmembrane domain-containing protein-like n=1 Tax=Aricia agestis TaxID=91739 RepID=UPI001C20842E|nr:multiple C2 and transmembrane domain-containing protein-like [Aricia agestis]
MELATSTSEKVKKSRGWDTIVTVVLVNAKNIPVITEDGHVHNLYCKFRLGSETFKSKSVPGSKQPEWRERFELRMSEDHELHISLWDRGKQKNSMGSCVLDLSSFEKERTHEIWQELENGFGAIHFTLTMCVVRAPGTPETNAIDLYEKKPVHRFRHGWKIVGVLHVAVIEAKGLTSKPNAYCVLEIDNERVQTHKAGSSAEPKWNKTYMFNVYDVSSTLDIKVYDSTLNMISDSIGKVSIPLLRVQNGEMRWYALKDRSKRHNAKGNCPRILLQMSLVWDPLKATLRLFQPKEVKHIKKPPKFDVGLIYSNIQFVTNIFIFIEQKHEVFKRLFEWDDKELSLVAVLCWIVFCHYITLWSLVLMLLLPFFYYWLINRHQDHIHDVNSTKHEENKKNKEGIYVTGKLQDLQTMTLTITNSIEFISSHAEKIHNLVSFKVPFFSYVAIAFLLVGSLGVYLLPFNYILMGLGVYKFGRKYLNPSRILNNDLLDFFSRIPDNHLLEEWKELSVPEPNQDVYVARNLNRSISTSI